LCHHPRPAPADALDGRVGVPVCDAGRSPRGCPRRSLMEGEYRLAAPAKLNLSLRVVGRRPDGFHELEGVMVLLELADELRLAPGDEGLLVEPSTAGVPRESTSNLAWRGLAAAMGDSPRGSLSLTKHIPVAAGLGGG